MKSKISFAFLAAFWYNARMFLYTNTEQSLQALGRKIRAARIAKGDTQKVFAFRIGVSVPTLRAMESGSPSTSLAAFLNALEAIGRIGDIDGVLSCTSPYGYGG
jgi:Helix-turn-helix.